MLILLLAMLLNIFLFLNINKIEKKCLIYKEELLQKDIDLIQLKQYEFIMQTNIQNSNIYLNVENVIIDTVGNEIFVRDLFQKDFDYIFVCRFSERCCKDCVLNAFSQLKKYSSFIMIDKVLFLGLYNTTKDFNWAKSNLDINNLQVYNSYEFDIPAEKLSYPYYFVLDSKLRILDVFFPDKNTPDITKKYLIMINEKYFNKHD
ncbi:MAG: hypothetical protein VB122_00635 [Erysipelotrichales bacterium]|nr:hypothetical protein [Erysipelotrichales bacterium]